MEQGQTPPDEPQTPPPSGQWPAWQQHPQHHPPQYYGQPGYYGQPAYYGQTPYYGAPPVPAWPQPAWPQPAWPQPATQATLVKAPPGEHPKELPWRLAGWWSRVGAQLLDLLVVWVPGAIALAIPIVAASDARDGSGAERAWLIAAIVLSFLVVAAHLFYAPLLMRRSGKRNGQTLGKQVTGIRVIRADGEPMNFSFAALRQIIYKSFGGIVASTFIPLFPWLLNYLWPTWDEQHRALHDLAANTRVVAA